MGKKQPAHRILYKQYKAGMYKDGLTKEQQDLLLAHYPAEAFSQEPEPDAAKVQP